MAIFSHFELNMVMCADSILIRPFLVKYVGRT